MALIHELYGIQAAKLEERTIAFNNTMALLVGLKTGARGLDSFEFTEDGGWKSVEPKPAPTKPEAQEHPRPE